MPALITWWTLDVGQLAPEAHNDTVAFVGADLLRRWSEPARAYHTTSHLVEMFWALEELEEAGEIDDEQVSVARIAAWFHDAVYDPTAAPGANESDSGELARESLASLRFRDDLSQKVQRLIALTLQHETDVGDPVDDAFHDADLWILAAPTERFDEYCAQVRKEYVHVPDPAYRQGRCAVLEPLRQRDSVYRTAHAAAQWEGQARVNLGRELDRLRG